jgi:hypothetical protein
VTEPAAEPAIEPVTEPAPGASTERTIDDVPPAAAARPAGDDDGPAEEPVSIRALLRERLEGHQASAQAMAGQGKPPPVLDLVGGPVGLVETVVPVAVFSTVYGVTTDLRTSLVAAIVPAVVVSVWRLSRRESLTTALSGLFAVGIGAFIASRTGRASDFFWPSVIKNAAYGLAYGGSAVVGWPLIGLLLGYLLGEGTAWRRVPARKRAYQIATWLWCGMFMLRVVIQTPLLLADKTVLLGAVNIFLGLPLFFLTIWATWMVVRRVPVVHQDPAGEAELEGAGSEAPEPADPHGGRPVPGEEPAAHDEPEGVGGVGRTGVH